MTIKGHRFCMRTRSTTRPETGITVNSREWNNPGTSTLFFTAFIGLRHSDLDHMSFVERLIVGQIIDDGGLFRRPRGTESPSHRPHVFSLPGFHEPDSLFTYGGSFFR